MWLEAWANSEARRLCTWAAVQLGIYIGFWFSWSYFSWADWYLAHYPRTTLLLLTPVSARTRPDLRITFRIWRSFYSWGRLGSWCSSSGYSNLAHFLSVLYGMIAMSPPDSECMAGCFIQWIFSAGTAGLGEPRPRVAGPFTYWCIGYGRGTHTASGFTCRPHSAGPNQETFSPNGPAYCPSCWTEHQATDSSFSASAFISGESLCTVVPVPVGAGILIFAKG